MIEITFLGTGSAVPTLKRNHPAVLLKYKTECILFDCGEGTQKQFRKAKISPLKLTRIFISHWHGDHVFGLPGLLQTLALNDYSKTLEIYCPKGTGHFMKKMLELFVHRGEISVNVNEVGSGVVLETSDFRINAEEMNHGTPCLAYSFAEKDKIRIDKNKLKKLKIPNSPLIGKLKQGKDIIINGRKINSKNITYTEKGKKVAVAMDTRENKNLVKIAHESDLLICEATYLNEEELAGEYGHLTAKQAGNAAKQAKVKKLIIMHLSQKYEAKTKEFLREIRKYFKNSEIAEDMMKVKV